MKTQVVTHVNLAFLMGVFFSLRIYGGTKW